MHIVFVCTGNICRSPTAQAVLRQRIDTRGLGDRLSVSSAGLEAWHAGDGPDRRSIHHARQRGYQMSDLRARPLRGEEFEVADWVLVMDAGRLAVVRVGHLAGIMHTAEVGQQSQLVRMLRRLIALVSRVV